MFVACQRHDPAADDGSVFRLVLQSDPETFDPAVMTGSVEGRVAYQVFEGLVSPAEDGVGVVPGVASDWSFSDDLREARFTLRADARWSNGDPVTSRDFVYAWKRILCRDVAADYVAFVEQLDGAKEYAAACANGRRDAVWTGVEAVSPHELVVRADEPTPWFLEMLGFYTFFPVHRGSIEELGEDDAFRENNLITNGPYRVSGYQLQHEIVLTRNPHYHSNDDVYFDRVVFSLIEDSRTAYHAFRSGRVDWVSSVPNEVLPFLQGLPSYRTAPQLAVYFYRFNVTKPPFDDVRVRRAFAESINRRELASCTLHGVKVAETFVPPMPGYRPPSPLRYDTAVARSLIAQRTSEDETKLAPIRLVYNTDENHRLIAESIQASWSRELGVDVELVNREWRIYLQAMDTLDFELARAGWIGDYTDPMTFLDLWTTGHPNNDTGWGDERYDALIAAARVEPSRPERMRIMAEAEAILLDEVPVVPLYFYGQHHLVSEDIRGWQMNPRDIHLIRRYSRSSEGPR